MLGVGEKLLRAGNDCVLNRQKPVMEAVSQDKAHGESRAETRVSSQSPGEKGQNVEMVPHKSRISSPKASVQQQGYAHSK